MFLFYLIFEQSELLAQNENTSDKVTFFNIVRSLFRYHPPGTVDGL